jgi:hypothetical protein
MFDMLTRFYDRLTNSVQGRKDGAHGVPVVDGGGSWTTPHLHGYLSGQLRARLDLELVRLAAKLREMDPAITRQRLVVHQRQRDLAELVEAAPPSPPKDPADKRELVDYLRTRRRHHTQVAQVTTRRDEHRRQRDQAEQDLAQLCAKRARLIDETAARMHGQVANTQALSGIYARRVLRRHEAGPELSRRPCSVETELTDYFNRLAALAETPHLTTEST